jgi:hypothetical protein
MAVLIFLLFFMSIYDVLQSVRFSSPIFQVALRDWEVVCRVARQPSASRLHAETHSTLNDRIARRSLDFLLSINRQSFLIILMEMTQFPPYKFMFIQVSFSYL